MRPLLLLLLIACQLPVSSEAKAETAIHEGAQLGALLQLKHNLTPSLGGYSLFRLKESQAAVHTSAWVNVYRTSGGGIGGGTIHQLNHHLAFGWELSAEYETEEHGKVWFVGAGPVLEVEATDRFHAFLKAPVGWENAHHHNQVGWAVLGGLAIAVWL